METGESPESEKDSESEGSLGEDENAEADHHRGESGDRGGDESDFGIEEFASQQEDEGADGSADQCKFATDEEHLKEGWIFVDSEEFDSSRAESASQWSQGTESGSAASQDTRQLPTRRRSGPLPPPLPLVQLPRRQRQNQTILLAVVASLAALAGVVSGFILRGLF